MAREPDGAVLTAQPSQQWAYRQARETEAAVVLTGPPAGNATLREKMLSLCRSILPPMGTAEIDVREWTGVPREWCSLPACVRWEVLLRSAPDLSVAEHHVNMPEHRLASHPATTECGVGEVSGWVEAPPLPFPSPPHVLPFSHHLTPCRPLGVCCPSGASFRSQTAGCHVGHLRATRRGVSSATCLVGAAPLLPPHPPSSTIPHSPPPIDTPTRGARVFLPDQLRIYDAAKKARFFMVSPYRYVGRPRSIVG